MKFECAFCGERVYCSPPLLIARKRKSDGVICEVLIPQKTYTVICEVLIPQKTYTMSSDDECEYSDDGLHQRRIVRNRPVRR